MNLCGEKRGIELLQYESVRQQKLNSSNKADNYITIRTSYYPLQAYLCSLKNFTEYL